MTASWSTVPHDGAGKVVSEAKRGGSGKLSRPVFPGQRHPAAGPGALPAQHHPHHLRRHFKRIPIVPVLDASGEPLDLSFAHLRCVSPIHCEYLRNMGVGASMSISIVVDGALWGLIACHHYGPRTLSIGRRVAAEMFGAFFSCISMR